MIILGAFFKCSRSSSLQQNVNELPSVIGNGRYEPNYDSEVYQLFAGLIALYVYTKTPRYLDKNGQYNISRPNFADFSSRLEILSLTLPDSKQF